MIYWKNWKEVENWEAPNVPRRSQYLGLGQKEGKGINVRHMSNPYYQILMIDFRNFTITATKWMISLPISLSFSFCFLFLSFFHGKNDILLLLFSCAGAGLEAAFTEESLRRFLYLFCGCYRKVGTHTIPNTFAQSIKLNEMSSYPSLFIYL